MVSWFSLKWKTSFPESHLPGRPSPGSQTRGCAATCLPQAGGFIALVPIPKRMGKTDGTSFLPPVLWAGSPWQKW